MKEDDWLRRQPRAPGASTAGAPRSLLSFSNTSLALRRQADTYFSGYLVPGLLPSDRDARLRGIMHAVNKERGFGFLTVRTGLGIADLRDDVFLHINDFLDPGGAPISNPSFANLKTRQAIIEFELLDQGSGKFKGICLAGSPGRATFGKPPSSRTSAPVTTAA